MTSYKTRFQLMGTFIDLVVYHTNAIDLIKSTYLQLNQYAQRFTVNQSDSELMRINQNAGIKPVEVAPDMFELIKKAKAISIDPQNPFNLAIGPLVKAWRIGFKDANIPKPSELKRLLPLINPQNIMLDDKTHSVFLLLEKMEIDLGAIAKGFFADEIKQYWQNQGVERGIINLGGNVLTLGSSCRHADKSNHTDKMWHVGIQHPLFNRGKVCRVVPIKCGSVVTSGINERFFSAAGQQYHHLLDSHTGMPIASEIASVTIISKHSIDGEIWSTAGFLSTAEEAISYLNQQVKIEAVVISKQAQIYLTQGLIDDGKLIGHS